MIPITTASFILVICSTTFSTAASRHNTDNSIRQNWEVDTGIPGEVLEKLRAVQDRGVQWLQNQKTEEFGWPSGDTARVVIALASAIEDWPAKNDLVARLIVKQLEIELLEKLLRKDIDPVTPAKVAFFALALGASCKDPHNFYGHNLVASVEKHHEDLDFPGYPEAFGYSLTSLVTCLAGSHLHKRQIRHLIQIAENESTKQFSVDTRGTALMALECVRHRKKIEWVSRRMHEPLVAISEQQQSDGSFGNIHTSAIAIQALAGTRDEEIHWNKTGAALYLNVMQEPNGSFLNSMYATTESVIAASALLNGYGLLGLRRGHCNSLRRHKSKNRATTSTSSNSAANFITDIGQSGTSTHGSLRPVPKINSGSSQDVNIADHLNENAIDSGLHKGDGGVTTAASPKSSSSGPTSVPQLVTVRYWLWIGPDPPTAERYNLTVRVPANNTFFFVMQRASELVAEYEFSSTVWPNGHYIHTISGHREQPIGYHYWLLYLLKSDPDPASPPSTTFVAPAGVDDLRVQDGQVYLFWFKKI